MKKTTKNLWCPTCGKFQGFIWIAKCLYKCSVCGRIKERVGEKYKVII